jgi:amino acid transporter
VINCIIGSGIFGLPADVAKLVGGGGPWAYVLAAAGIGIVIAAHAELASQFRVAGGPYLYAREAFGQFAGIQIGWFALLVRFTSAAANANLFVVYLGEFWSGATLPWARAGILIAFVGSMAAANYRGVKGGVRLSNTVTVAKLVPLAFFIVAGLLLVSRPAGGVPVPDVGVANWMNAVTVLVFAFAGFETAIMPMAEAKDPRRDAPFALFTGLAVITVAYILIHVICMWTLPNLATTARPLAEVARVLIGPGAAVLMAAGAMLSTYGNITAQLVGVPRLMFALAQSGDFPRVLGVIHSRFRTPSVAIVLWAVLVLGLAIYGNFIWNAVLSVAARVVTYGAGCAALIRLRITRPDADALRLPAGNVLAVIGVAFCAAIALRMTGDHARIIGVVAAIGIVNWLVVRRRQSA